MPESDSNEERQARSLALEKAYVHDVYDQIAPHFTDTRYRAWPRVKQFLLDLEPASLVADVGCGNGKYLDINPEVMKVGSDRCAALTEAARAKQHEVVTCDNLQLPFRDETFDAALSIAVIHHFATTDRRVAALKELARVLRIGGKVLITVWAMEQRHRKFDSQDVLVPWHEPVKSSSEDRGSSVERELTSTTTSDDDVLVYHAYSHISDSESQHPSGTSAVNRKRQKFRNGRGRYRSTGSFEHHSCAATSSQSSSELSSPNETCYSFVRRALQKLSNSATTPYSRRNNSRPYFYRSCRRPCISDSMEFGPHLQPPASTSPRHDLFHQESVDSECQDQQDEDDVPIELRHLEGYEPCVHCGSPMRDDDMERCERHACASCLPIDPDGGSRKSRSLGDFLNMIPKLLRVKKCEKVPLSDLHKRISTASDPREYVIKSRGANVNGIVRSKSTVSFMSRLEEIMALSVADDHEEFDTSSCGGVSSTSTRAKIKPPRLPSLTSSSVINEDGTVTLHETDLSTNPRRYTSPADALRKLRQEASLEEKASKLNGRVDNTIQNGDITEDTVPKHQNIENVTSTQESNKLDNIEESNSAPSTSLAKTEKESKDPTNQTNDSATKDEDDGSSQESHMSSYYSMPELYKLTEDQIPEESIFVNQRQRHISFYEQAQTVLAENETTVGSHELRQRRHDSSPSPGDERMLNLPQRGLVKRSLSVDTGDNTSSSHQVPRRFSASAAQGVLATALRTYTLPRSSSRGSSVKSDTSIDSEESIVSVIPRKGNSITSDTSVDSEESVISVIQRSTSEIETLVRENGLRNNISRLGSRSAQASPVTVLSSQTSSAESSPPQSGKSDGRFPGSGGVIDQLMQQQQLLHSSPQTHDVVHFRHDIADHLQRTRRSLLRPISDPKIEERLDSGMDDGSCFGKPIRQTPSNRSSMEMDDHVIVEDDERKERIVKPLKIHSTPLKTVLQAADEKLEHPAKREIQMDDLSRTPSPIGPFKYITDPLLTEDTVKINSICKGIRLRNARDSLEAQDHTASDNKSKGGAIHRDEIKNSATERADKIRETEVQGGTESVLSPSDKDKSLTTEGKASVFREIKKESTDIMKTGYSFEGERKKMNFQNLLGKEDSKNETLTSEHRNDAGIRGRISFLSSGFQKQMGTRNSNVNRTIAYFEANNNKVLNAKEEIRDDPEAINGSLFSLSDSKEGNRCEGIGKDEEKTKSPALPTETQKMGCRGLKKRYSSEKDESVEKKNVLAENEIKNVLQQNKNDVLETTEQNTEEIITPNLKNAVVGNDNNTSNAVVVDNEEASEKSSDEKTILPRQKTEADRSEKSSPLGEKSETRSMPQSYAVVNIRSGFRKELRRSCVTIDEVECREVVSSEETSPSSSASLEWNDFDKTEALEAAAALAAADSNVNPSSLPSSDAGEHQEITSPEACCDDVNVAETESKFNVFLDKEICVFFETPSSSIGKSASSSSNATDFSTTSERIRGVMQREKSDDRSSKESDSDNLSKLSDLEAKSDSAFSEDFARRTDEVLASSSSSASSEMIDSIRTKLSNEVTWCDTDGNVMGHREKHSSASWVLDNIDEIPDAEKYDDEHRSKECDERTLMKVYDWTNDKSLNFAQRKENFLSCSADCRDMYRISFDDTSPKKSPGGESYQTDSTNKEPDSKGRIDLIMPDLAPGPPNIFPQSLKDSDENETQTDILAAFVETISDLTSVFGELYPRHEGKFEDVSSDESVEISSFERILTARDPSHSHQDRSRRNRENYDKNKAVDGGEEGTERRFGGRSDGGDRCGCPASNGVFTIDCQNNDGSPRDMSSKNRRHGQDGLESSGSCSHSRYDNTGEGCSKDSGTRVRKKEERDKMLNRSSQSMSMDRADSPQESAEDTVTNTQSAPCSPSLKPRQPSVEEMAKSKPDFSRNSSLSQSTSQESLPGNESGGLMAYHRYYHVFRQGELDNLIENYVENLHIIASYYDHANWCVVAEKVQVWTI